MEVQRKAFCRQRIPESSCAIKEAVDIDLLITSRNGDRKFIQPVRIASEPAMRMPGEWGSGTGSTTWDEYLPK